MTAGWARRVDTAIGRASIQLGLATLLLLIWEAGVRLGLVSGFLFGSPSGIARNFSHVLADGTLFYDVWITLYESILGFVIGTVAGSLLGLALWYSRFVARLVEPLIIAFNSVPKIALAPIIILWFGTGLSSKVALAISLTAIVALISAYQAAKEADPDLLSLLLTLGASKNQIFYKAVIPSALPGIIATFRINVGFGLVGAVVGEFISSQRGLGHMIFTASSFYDLDTVWLGLFTLMAIGFGLYFVIDTIERRMLPWKLDQHRAELHV
jgi:NitT/TauT family transport system permease protein